MCGDRFVFSVAEHVHNTHPTDPAFISNSTPISVYKHVLRRETGVLVVSLIRWIERQEKSLSETSCVKVSILGAG